MKPALLYYLLIPFLFFLSISAQEISVPLIEGDLYGLADIEGNQILEPQFDEIEPISDNYGFLVKKLFFYGIIDNKGNVILDCSYHNLVPYNNDLWKATVNDKSALFSKKRKKIISRFYNNILNPEGNFARVKLNEKYGVISLTGKELISPEYNYINEARDGYFAVYKDGKFGWRDTTGARITHEKYDACWFFKEGISVYKTGSKYGYVDSLGNEICGAVYDTAYAFTGGYGIVKKDSLYGYMGKDGKLLLPVKYMGLGFFGHGFGYIVENGKWSIIDEEGKLINDQKYDMVNYFGDGIAVVSKKGKYGAINTDGEVVIPFIYDEMGVFSCGLACAKKDDKYGYINAEGEKIIDFRYERNFRFADNRAYAARDNKFGIIDTEGKILVPVEYDSLKYGKENFIIGQKEGKLGVITLEGKTILPNIYDDISYLEIDSARWLYKVKKGELYGLFKPGGEEFLETGYDLIGDFINGYSQVLQRFFIGYISADGYLIYPAWHKAWNFYDGYAVVSFDDKYGVINNKGDIIIDAEYPGLKYNREGMVAYQGENGKWGYMKLTPKIEKITEPLFEDIFYFKNGVGMVKKSKEGEWIRINKNGRLFENKREPPKKYNPYMFDKVGLAGTDVRTIKSDSVGQEYKLHIYLPKSYNENVNKRYPVIYLLDSDVLIGTVKETYDLMKYDRQVPEAIIVGIAYEQTFEDWYRLRTRDFTPSTDETAAMFPGGGGSERFRKFITDELFPFIRENYKVSDNDRTLIGYSFGGLFAAEMMLRHPGIFRRYIMISPSFWWDQRVAFKWEEQYAAKYKDLNASLFISLGGEEKPFMGAKDMYIKLTDRKYPSLDMTYYTVDGESHYTSVPEAIVKALRFIFRNEKNRMLF